MTKRKQPAWMSDYEVNIMETNSQGAVHMEEANQEVLDEFTPYTYPYVIPKYFTGSYIDFLANISVVKEPDTFIEANMSLEWRKAMEAEIDAPEKNKT